MHFKKTRLIPIPLSTGMTLYNFLNVLVVMALLVGTMDAALFASSATPVAKACVVDCGGEYKLDDWSDSETERSMDWADVPGFDCNEVESASAKIKAGKDYYDPDVWPGSYCYGFEWNQTSFRVWEKKHSPFCKNISHVIVSWECECYELCSETILVEGTWGDWAYNADKQAMCRSRVNTYVDKYTGAWCSDQPEEQCEPYEPCTETVLVEGTWGDWAYNPDKQAMCRSRVNTYVDKYTGGFCSEEPEEQCQDIVLPSGTASCYGGSVTNPNLAALPAEYTVDGKVIWTGTVPAGSTVQVPYVLWDLQEHCAEVQAGEETVDLGCFGPCDPGLSMWATLGCEGYSAGFKLVEETEQSYALRLIVNGEAQVQDAGRARSKSWSGGIPETDVEATLTLVVGDKTLSRELDKDCSPDFPPGTEVEHHYGPLTAEPQGALRPGQDTWPSVQYLKETYGWTDEQAAKYQAMLDKWAKVMKHYDSFDPCHESQIHFYINYTEVESGVYEIQLIDVRAGGSPCDMDHYARFTEQAGAQVFSIGWTWEVGPPVFLKPGYYCPVYTGGYGGVGFPGTCKQVVSAEDLDGIDFRYYDGAEMLALLMRAEYARTGNLTDDVYLKSGDASLEKYLADRGLRSANEMVLGHFLSPLQLTWTGQRYPIWYYGHEKDPVYWQDGSWHGDLDKIKAMLNYLAHPLCGGNNQSHLSDDIAGPCNPSVEKAWEDRLAAIGCNRTMLLSDMIPPYIAHFGSLESAQ